MLSHWRHSGFQVFCGNRKGLKLISDNGSQPTSLSFMKDMATLDIEEIFTSYDNPKGNAERERMIRRIKKEILWLHEFSSFEDAKEATGKWIEFDYNKLYVHSRIGYLSPEEYEELFYQNLVKQAARKLYTLKVSKMS